MADSKMLLLDLQAAFKGKAMSRVVAIGREMSASAVQDLPVLSQQVLLELFISTKHLETTKVVGKNTFPENGRAKMKYEAARSVIKNKSERVTQELLDELDNYINNQ